MNVSMKCVLLGAGLGLFVGLSTVAQGASPKAVPEGAKKLEQDFLAAFNRGDAEAISKLYWNSPEAVFFPPDAMESRGHAAIKAGWAEAFSSMKGAKLELTESHQMVEGDVVIGWGLWRLTMPGEDGQTTEMVGRYSDVKARRDGKWVYIVDHASVPLPPPPEEP